MFRSKSLSLCVAGLFVIGGMLACRKKSETAESPSASHPTPGREVLYWYDPMKPEVHFDKPGKS
ncbi:MAG: heavy metal-binding domain-containing protein, partial [Thermoanaerobaculia bacterium]